MTDADEGVSGVHLERFYHERLQVEGSQMINEEYDTL
jgi:hypothetical protein